MDITQLLESAKLPEKEVSICLRGDLFVELDAAAQALADAERLERADGSLAAGTGKLEAARRVAAIRERMLADSATFRMRAVSRRRWTALHAEHPPREGDASDSATGFNRETFFDALTRESIIDPQMTADEWDKLADLLSDPQYEALAEAAWSVNRQGADVPFSSAASLVLNLSEPASGRPEDSASAPSGSTAGSRPRSTNTTNKAASSRPAKKASGTRSSKR